MHDRLDHPLTLLPTTELTDFGRNLYELERRAKRPYSLTSVLRSMCECRRSNQNQPVMVELKPATFYV